MTVLKKRKTSEHSIRLIRQPILLEEVLQIHTQYTNIDFHFPDVVNKQNSCQVTRH